MKSILLTGLLALLPLRGLGALEVSLEENKAERGNIGFVDMGRLFRLYPETQKAKNNFEEVLRQAEDQVNLKKAELIGMRAEIIKLRMERDVAAKLSGAMAPPAAPAASTGAPTGVDGSTQAVAASSGTLVASSTETAAAVQPAPSQDQGAPLIINLPGLSPEPILVQPPSGGAQGSASLMEIDARINERTRQLQEKDAEFKTYQAQVEKNLLEMEGKRTEILLGKIYSAVREVAREEGVSVVIDKNQILFGHNAMDLTDKVLKKLKS